MYGQECTCMYSGTSDKGHSVLKLYIKDKFLVPQMMTFPNLQKVETSLLSQGVLYYGGVPCVFLYTRPTTFNSSHIAQLTISVLLHVYMSGLLHPAVIAKQSGQGGVGGCGRGREEERGHHKSQIQWCTPK